MSNLQVTREKLPTGTAEPQISGFFSKLLKLVAAAWADVFDQGEPGFYGALRQLHSQR
jgi:hypothetical protein